MVKKIILSTDIGTDIDDAIALYLCTQNPEIDLRGVYITNGNLDLRGRIARKLLNLAGYNTEVALGEADSLTREIPPYHIGFEPTYLTKREQRKSLRGLGIEKNGVNAMKQRLKESDVGIVSIAPLTNLARVLEENPRLRRRVYLMGGREGISEHNFRHDVEAAQQVFESELDILVIPADVCDRYKIDADILCNLGKSPATRYIAKMAQAWKVYQEISALRNSGLVDTLKDLERRNPYFYVPQHILEGLELITHQKHFIKEYPGMLEFYKMFRGSMQLNRGSIATRIIGETLKEHELKQFSISDAYAVYAVVHPEKIKTKRASINIKKNGVMKVGMGDKHELVTDLDYEDFDRFLKSYLK